ncbi:patatin-like phospholipase family protein [Streptomyces sp. NPDC050560]|uniref:patatin-like phospholipase family protein n=1 Tax=Streptomyces sp. NPDC050560 TaxID=3365630 RepID=UPI00379D51D8
MRSDPWPADHPVLEALRRRRDGDRSAGPDGLKIGLAVEGGGIRGVVSAAMLCALEDLGFRGAFDAVYAASSGSINSGYFLSGDTWHRLSIYYDDLATRRFVDPRRALRGNIMDLEYVFGIVDRVKPMDYRAVLASPTRLHVAVTLVDELRTAAVADFDGARDLRAALVASTWLPIALRGTASYRGSRALDGGVLTPHPFRLALADGCTHVLSLSTKPIAPPPARITVAQRYAIRHLDRVRPGLGAGYRDGLVRYRDERRTLQHRMIHPGRAPYVLDLAPMPWMPEVKRYELDPGRIIAGARGGYEVMYCAMEGVEPRLLHENRLRAVPRLTMVGVPPPPFGQWGST